MSDHNGLRSEQYRIIEGLVKQGDEIAEIGHGSEHLWTRERDLYEYHRLSKDLQDANMHIRYYTGPEDGNALEAEFSGYDLVFNLGMAKASDESRVMRAKKIFCRLVEADVKTIVWDHFFGTTPGYTVTPRGPLFVYSRVQ